MAQAQRDARQNVLEQARRLHTRLHQALSTVRETQTRLGGQRPSAQRECISNMRKIIEQAQNDVWPALQGLVFSDIKTLDECVIALNDWNNLLRDTHETLQEAQRTLYLVVLKQYEAYFGMQEFLNELHKVVTRCILQIGLLAH